MAAPHKHRVGGSLPSSSPAPFNPEASCSTVRTTPDEKSGKARRDQGRGRRAQSLPLDVERRIGGAQEFLVRPEVSRVSLFPPLNMREVSRNYRSPTPPKVRTYDRPTASSAAMCGNVSAEAAASTTTTTTTAAAAAASGDKIVTSSSSASSSSSTAQRAPAEQHVLDLHAADMDPTERVGIDPEDMYTHVERWLPRDLAPTPRYVPPTPPPATVLRRRAALMTPAGHLNLGAEDPNADATPRGLHLYHDGSDDDDDGDEGVYSYDGGDDEKHHPHHQCQKHQQKQEKEEEEESQDGGLSSRWTERYEGDRGGGGAPDTAADLESSEDADAEEDEETTTTAAAAAAASEVTVTVSKLGSVSSRGVLRALDENIARGGDHLGSASSSGGDNLDGGEARKDAYGGKLVNAKKDNRGDVGACRVGAPFAVENRAA